jgi:hypothetical protein
MSAVRPNQHIIGKKAVSILERCLPDEWIIRRQDGDDDYGIDLEIEIVVPQKSGTNFIPTGFLIKAQVKGHQELVFNQSEYYAQSIKVSTVSYWLSIPLPVALFIIDTTNEIVYWADAKQGSRQSLPTSYESATFKIQQSQFNVRYFLQQMILLGNIEKQKDLLSKIIEKNSAIFDLYENSCCNDCFLPLDDDELSLFNIFYKDSELLARYTNCEIEPYDKWRKIASNDWNMYPDIPYQLANEALKHCFDVLTIIFDKTKKIFCGTELNYWQLIDASFVTKLSKIDIKHFVGSHQ